MLYTFMAAKRFINKEIIEKLRGNYCILDEEDNVNFINELNVTRSSMNSYRDLYREIGVDNYFEKDDDFHYLFKYIKRSNYYEYSNIKVSEKVFDKYNL